MAGQHVENLLRKFKGEKISIKSVSGGIYEGTVAEVTNDYICLIESVGDEESRVYILFTAIESMMAPGKTSD